MVHWFINSTHRSDNFDFIEGRLYATIPAEAIWGDEEGDYGIQISDPNFIKEARNGIRSEFKAIWYY